MQRALKSVWLPTVLSVFSTLGSQTTCAAYMNTFRLGRLHVYGCYLKTSHCTAFSQLQDQSWRAEIPVTVYFVALTITFGSSYSSVKYTVEMPTAQKLK